MTTEETLRLTLVDEAATARLGRLLAAKAEAGDVIALEGGLGSGKTALARAFIRALAGEGEEVPSPTFTLAQSYDCRNVTIWHFDLYRLGDPGDAGELGMDEAFFDAISLIEWPERLGDGRLPERRLLLRLDPGGDENGRVATLVFGPAWRDRLFRAGLVARGEAAAAFLDVHGWGGARRHRLAGDASFRGYERLEDGSRRAMLMDAPPPNEDVRPFLSIARHLAALGYSAPHVAAAEETAGFLLLEDLGDDTFTRLLARGEDEATLYRLAVDVLIDLHRKGSDAIPVGLACYDDDRLLNEASLLVDWYIPAVTGRRPDASAVREYRDLWRELLPAMRAVPQTLVLRDFHVDNLMRLDRPGVAACGLLDFQDAVAGPVTYDLMSLLEDARRDIAPALATAMKEHYLLAFPGLGREAFAASFAVLAAQRHAKVIGIFTRLSRRDGKSCYLRHIPRLWRLFGTALLHPRMAGLKAWLDRHLPVPVRLEPKP